MYYSVTFDGTKNTWDDWGLIPESPPSIDPPEPVTNFVTIPGRQKGAIDLSKEPWGKLTYERVTGSWTFLKELTGPTTRMDTYNAIRSWLHGRTCKVEIEDDPTHYYMGMFTVGAPQSGPNVVRITIKYNLEPVRYNKSNNAIDTSYVNDFAG